MSIALLARHKFTRFAALALFLSAAALVGFAQPPEVEDPNGKVRKKIVVDDDPVSGKKGQDAPTGNPPDVKLDELVRASEDARTPALKTLYLKYAIPSDRVNQPSGGLQVKPIPIRRNEWPQGQ